AAVLVRPATFGQIVAALDINVAAVPVERRHMSLDRVIWEFINQAVLEAGSVSEAARRLQLDRTSLKRMLRKVPPPKGGGGMRQFDPLTAPASSRTRGASTDKEHRYAGEQPSETLSRNAPEQPAAHACGGARQGALVVQGARPRGAPSQVRQGRRDPSHPSPH